MDTKSFPSTLIQKSIRRFQIVPLWRAFSKSSVFVDLFVRISVDGRRIRNNKVAFSNLSGIVWTRPLSLYLPICLSVCLSVCLSDCLSACLYFCLSFCLSVSVYLSLYLCLSVSAICLSDCLSVFTLFACLSVIYYSGRMTLK